MNEPLPKRPNFEEYEPRLAQQWVSGRYFEAEIKEGQKPFTILLPPPNANAPLHAGHVLYVVEDILCRYHRMKGRSVLFLPGTDHAGIETQFVLEKKLQKEGKSRFDYDRNTLFDLVYKFVEENRGIATDQLKRLGFSLDWSRERYTMNPEILKTVLSTFKKLHDDEMIFRDERLVNYCTHCGTGFSNLEINHKERDDELYYLDYKTVTIATTRPETIFADTAVAVNPNDERFKDLIGKTATVPLVNREIPIIADEAVEVEFGTGALKITPGHDFTDYEIGERHDLPRISVIERTGKMTNVPEYIAGMYPSQARKETVKRLEEAGLLKKTEPIHHAVGVCYKCGNVIEPLLMPQWYIKIAPLVERVITALEIGEVEVFPDRFGKQLHHWLETAPDWNISRQIVWGPRIPVWYDVTENPDVEVTFIVDGATVHDRYSEARKEYSFEHISKGLQEIVAPIGTKYYLDAKDAPSDYVLQETDTFDTWFSSGQWPLTTLGYPDSDDFKYFYPTSVIDTMWDILPFWIMRMLMFGLYLTDKVPFEKVHMHSRVVDSKGQKMSKSKGNVVNPMELVEKYGADALRFALVFGVAPASDIPLGEEKMIGGRNLITKIWNIARFILAIDPETANKEGKDDAELKELINQTIGETEKNIEAFQFGIASENLYHVIWDQFASVYLERYKEGEVSYKALTDSFGALLKLLHPFIPFITEELFAKLPGNENRSASLENWPTPLP